MTIPGGDSGEETHNEANAPLAEPTQTQDGPDTASASSAPSGMQPPPSGYSPSYPPPYPPAYPPPTGYPPPGYQEPPGYPGYRGSPYPPGSPGYGAPYPSGYERPYPAPDHPDGYGQPSATGTNKLAIAALVASCLGLFCGLGSVAGIVLGAVALNHIKQTRQEGSGLAVAAIVLGIASLVIFVVYIIYARHHLGTA
ncbi:MAG: DUF4190 domain-containing protein [Mycobacterium sp.]|uniref:DUF4190 domain-containing protein n=1 Tax=Mycobacterium sp. TaxID=1785 RepID=UPI002624D35F|nr:DUF4190 domain-containing protein [Mycobacterium sp.]MDI3315486.1 DUF4190 domain-containing protein [Mycobacterium sp.]